MIYKLLSLSSAWVPQPLFPDPEANRTENENATNFIPSQQLLEAGEPIPNRPRLESQQTTPPALQESEQRVRTVPEIPKQDLVSGYASLQGIAKVFDKHMCNAISKVTIDGEVKAAVTLVFPARGKVDCLMSLEVGEWGVEWLAMSLFNIKVKWVEQVLHVGLKEGTTLTMPETTLRGVPDKAIMEVFGSEVYNAITQCPGRKMDVAQGVSMNLTKSGAIINLSLGLEGGLQIQVINYTARLLLFHLPIGNIQLCTRFQNALSIRHAL